MILIKKTDIKNILNIKFKIRTINYFKYTKKMFGSSDQNYTFKHMVIKRSN